MYKQNQQFRPHTVAVCMVSLPMKTNVTFFGTVGMVKLAVINAHRAWHTIVRRVFACGPIKFQNVEMKVRPIFKRFYLLKTIFQLISEIRFILFIIEEVANGFACPAAGEIALAGTFSRHAHPEDCRKYYICLEGVAREYGCPIGTVFKIGDSDGTGNCEEPEDVPGW